MPLWAAGALRSLIAQRLGQLQTVSTCKGRAAAGQRLQRLLGEDMGTVGLPEVFLFDFCMLFACVTPLSCPVWPWTSRPYFPTHAAPGRKLFRFLCCFSTLLSCMAIQNTPETQHEQRTCVDL